MQKYLGLSLLKYGWGKKKNLILPPEKKETLEKWEKLWRILYSKHSFYFCIPSVELGQREAKKINLVLRTCKQMSEIPKAAELECKTYLHGDCLSSQCADYSDIQYFILNTSLRIKMKNF